MPEGSQPLRLALARTLPFDSLFSEDFTSTFNFEP